MPSRDRSGRRRHSLSAAPLAIAVLAMSATGALGAGKPGYPDRIAWSDATWSIKTSRNPVGPGPNIFDRANVWVDSAGALHLRVARNADGNWSAAEIIGPTTHGYGTYTFRLASRVDDLDANVVLGLFTWSDRARYAHREIDIEFARWGNAADSTNAQYVVQPHATAAHLRRFTQPAAPSSTHRFTWRPGQITWQSFDETGALIHAYTYNGADVPRSGDERVRLNLWLFGGGAPTNGLPAEVVISSFAFTP